MAKKKENGKKKPNIVEKFKDVDFGQFKPSFDALKDYVQEELKKRKEQGIDDIIQEAEIQRFEESIDDEMLEEFEKIKRDINPIFGIIFAPLNVYFKKIGITTISKTEQRKIQHFVFSIIEKTLKTSIVKYTEEIQKGTSLISRIYAFLDILFNTIIPRVQEFYEIKGKQKAAAIL